MRLVAGVALALFATSALAASKATPHQIAEQSVQILLLLPPTCKEQDNAAHTVSCAWATNRGLYEIYHPKTLHLYDRYFKELERTSRLFDQRILSQDDLIRAEQIMRVQFADDVQRRFGGKPLPVDPSTYAQRKKALELEAQRARTAPRESNPAANGIAQGLGAVLAQVLLHAF